MTNQQTTDSNNALETIREILYLNDIDKHK